MPDGYWTPWHLATARAEKAERERDEAREAVAAAGDMLSQVVRAKAERDADRAAHRAALGKAQQRLHEARKDEAAMRGERDKAQVELERWKLMYREDMFGGTDETAKEGT